jgi:hypothetical protein
MTPLLSVNVPTRVQYELYFCASARRPDNEEDDDNDDEEDEDVTFKNFNTSSGSDERS